MLKKAGDLHGLPIVTEVIDTRDVFLVSEYADLLQIGARNMQNFALLKEVGKAGTPVLLKRGMNSSLADWLNCAEYILKEGNSKVILCERGLKTVEDYTRNTLDLSIVSGVKDLSHLPIIADPLPRNRKAGTDRTDEPERHHGRLRRPHGGGAPASGGRLERRPAIPHAGDVRRHDAEGPQAAGVQGNPLAPSGPGMIGVAQQQGVQFHLADSQGPTPCGPSGLACLDRRPEASCRGFFHPG